MNKNIQKPENKKKMRSAMTIIEVGVVLIIAGLLALAVFAAYNKYYIPTQADNEYQRVQTVISSLERSKKYNNSVFLTGDGSALNTYPLLVNAMGGAANVADVGAWTYNCPAGADQTITVTTSNYDDATVLALVQSLVTSNNAPWQAAVVGSTLQMTKANVTCQ